METRRECCGRYKRKGKRCKVCPQGAEDQGKKRKKGKKQQGG